MENVKIALLIVLSYIKEAFKWIKRKIKSFFVWVFSKTTIDEKVIEVAEEISDRAKVVKEELKDVKKALGNVVDQTKDVTGAIKGKKRRGRPKKS